jgi:threonine synthase
MDVGAPSNFERMSAHWSTGELQRMITGVFVSDEDTKKTIGNVHQKYGYFLDPHTAVGWAGLDSLNISAFMQQQPYAILSTAHPAKFAETVEPLTGHVPVPASLQKVMERTPTVKPIPADVGALIEALG